MIQNNDTSAFLVPWKFSPSRFKIGPAARQRHAKRKLNEQTENNGNGHTTVAAVFEQKLRAANLVDPAESHAASFPAHYPLRRQTAGLFRAHEQVSDNRTEAR